MPPVSTLHSFALSVLLQMGEGARLPQPVRIADDWEERWIIYEDVKDECGLDRIRMVEERFDDLSADWDTLAAEATDWPRTCADPAFVGAWQHHRDLYGYTLRAEMVFQLKRAIEEGTLVDEMVPEHLIVDEYQDLNPCDLAVIDYLCEAGASIFVAGDDDQSIYGFRHARPEGIREFGANHDGAGTYTLHECHRCGSTILAIGEWVASQDTGRVPKGLTCAEGACTGSVSVLHFRDQHQEAEGVASLCSHIINVGGIEPDQMLILVRQDTRGAISAPILAALQRNGIPACIRTDPLAVLNPGHDDPLGGRRFLAVLRLITRPRDDLAWRTLLQVDSCGVGDGTLGELNRVGRSQGLRFSEVLARVESDPTMVPRGRIVGGAVRAIQEEVDRCRGALSAVGAFSIFIDTAAEESIPDERLRHDVVHVLRTAAEQLGLSRSDEDTLDSLLSGLTTSVALSEQNRPDDTITIMTMHQAKGLSAEAVIVVGVEDQFVPGKAEDQREVDDQRRLLYVSLTRAKQQLYITHCHRRTGTQARLGRMDPGGNRRLSRFLSSGPVHSQNGPAFVAALCH